MKKKAYENMKWKKQIKQLLILLVVLVITKLQLPGLTVVAAEKEKLPHLIQSTTLKEDYEALVNLDLTQTPRSEESDLETAYENILCSCVRIQVEGHYGSGNIYRMLEDEIIIVTNRHVLQYWNEDSLVTFFNGCVSEGTLLEVSDEADVGFLSVSAEQFTYEELLRLHSIRLPWTGAKEEDILRSVPMPGSRIFSVDMASEWNNPVKKEGKIISSSIYLEDFQAEMLYGIGEAIPGMSGSGVFDGYGNYLGMLTGGTPQGEIAAVPVKVIYSEYRKRL